MYGKTKITISQKGLIAREGNKSHEPVGRTYFVDGFWIGRLRNVGSWATSLDETNSIEFKVASKTELRNFVKTFYPTEL